MVVLAERIRTCERDFARSELVGFAGPALLARESDERLAALVREGDQNAFAAIVARYRLPLEHHCRRTLPPSRAEDALQQTFAKAYVALSEGAQPVALKAWLYAIAHNTSINGLRDRQGESLEAAGEFGAQHQTHDIVARRESLRSVVRAVGSLPSRQRQVLVRQEFEGASQEQIAAELGLTTGAVRQLAHRARNTVRAAASAIVPAPLWRLFPWQLGVTGGQEVALSSAFAAVVGKTAVVLLMATAAGGAVELTTGLPSAAAPANSRVVVPRTPAANGAVLKGTAGLGAVSGALSAGGTPAASHPGVAARPGHGGAGAGAAGAQGAQGAGAESSADGPSAGQPGQSGEPAAPAAGSGTGRQPQGSGSGVSGGSTAAQGGESSHQDSSASDAPDQPKSSSAHEIGHAAADAPDAVDAPDAPDAPDPVDAPDAPDPVDAPDAPGASAPSASGGSTPSGSSSASTPSSTSTSSSGSSG
jgi:RNA polymerase sigma factor (sigma-70 family)